MPLTHMRMWLCVLCPQVCLSQHVCGCTRLSPLRQNKDTDLHSLYIRFSTSYRRKFRSQTSDHMDRWKAEQGRGREKRKIRRKKSRRERVRRKKMQMREKVGKTQNTAFFQWIVAPEGRKVGSLKRQVRRHLKDDRSAVHLGRCSNHHVLLRSQHRCQVWHGPPSQCLPGRWNHVELHTVTNKSWKREEEVWNAEIVL